MSCRFCVSLHCTSSVCVLVSCFLISSQSECMPVSSFPEPYPETVTFIILYRQQVRLFWVWLVSRLAFQSNLYLHSMLPVAALWQYLVMLQDSKLQITKRISETTPGYSLRLHLLEVADGGRGPRLHSNQEDATFPRRRGTHPSSAGSSNK